MVNSWKISDELKCLLCAIDEYRTTLHMRDCDKNKTLFSLINVGLQLQAAIDCKKFTLAYLFSLVYLSCRIVVRSIYEFRMRSLHSSYQLRMKIITSSDQQQASSSADADDWIKIISVVSQSGQSTASSEAINHKTRRISIHTNGLVNGDPGQVGGDYFKGDLVKGRKISRTDSHSEDGSVKRASRNGYYTKTQISSDKGSRCNYSNGDDHKMTGMNQWNDWPDSRLSPDNISEDSDAIDVYDNEIYYINYAQDQNPEITSTQNMMSPEPTNFHSSDEDVGHKTPIDKTINEFPEMPEKHPKFLQVLYSAPVESALETESGGRINEQNDEITSASKKKSVVCSFCRKTMKNQLTLNRHVISTHIHDKRRAIKDHREQKCVDKKYVCDVCHSSFKTRNMLKKHGKSHNRMICEVCKAEYLNKMDFDWHRAQCSGENRSSCTIPGAWTRARSRQSRIPKDVERIVEMTQPIPDVKIQTTTVMHFEIQSTSANVTTTNAITSSTRLTEINKDEQLEKWVEESKKIIELDQLEHVPRSVRPKRTPRSRKRKKTTPRKQTRKRPAVSDHESEIEDITRETPALNCSFRASTPFPRRMSSVSSTGSILSNRPLSQASQNTSQTNLDSWAQHFSDIDDTYDDNASVYSNFTEISLSGQSDITARTGVSQTSNRSSRISSRTQFRSVSQCSVRTVESITSSITRLSSKPKTRRVANQLKKLEQELNQSRSLTDLTYNPGRHRRFRRHPYFEKKEKPVPLSCTEIECIGQPPFASPDELMEHQFEAHRMLRLFRCCECKTKFTQNEFLKEHKKIHTPGPYMCTLCDENLETESKLRLHFDLHVMKSLPCDYDYCDKLFLREIDKLQHNIKYHLRELNQEEEDKFVAQFLKKRARKGGPATIGGSRVRPLRRITVRNRNRNSVDLKTQSEYAKILEAMHSSDVNARLSPVPGCSNEHDTNSEKIQIRKRSTQDKSDIDQFELGLGICDYIINEKCEAATLKPPDFKLTHSENDTTENDHVSTRSSVLNDIIRGPNISLIARRKSRHVVSFEPLENEFTSFKLFCYSDIIKNKIKGDLNNISTHKAKPWRV